MIKSSDSVQPYQQRSRRETLGLLGAGAIMLGLEAAPGSALAEGMTKKMC